MTEISSLMTEMPNRCHPWATGGVGGIAGCHHPAHRALNGSVGALAGEAREATLTLTGPHFLG
jgi:hypothetical protein